MSPRHQWQHQQGQIRPSEINPLNDPFLFSDEDSDNELIPRYESPISEPPTDRYSDHQSHHQREQNQRSDRTAPNNRYLGHDSDSSRTSRYSSPDSEHRNSRYPDHHGRRQQEHNRRNDGPGLNDRYSGPRDDLSGTSRYSSPDSEQRSSRYSDHQYRRHQEHNRRNDGAASNDRYLGHDLSRTYRYSSPDSEHWSPRYSNHQSRHQQDYNRRNDRTDLNDRDMDSADDFHSSPRRGRFSRSPRYSDHQSRRQEEHDHRNDRRSSNDRYMGSSDDFHSSPRRGRFSRSPRQRIEDIVYPVVHRIVVRNGQRVDQPIDESRIVDFHSDLHDVQRIQPVDNGRDHSDGEMEGVEPWDDSPIPSPAFTPPPSSPTLPVQRPFNVLPEHRNQRPLTKKKKVELQPKKPERARRKLDSNGVPVCPGFNNWIATAPPQFPPVQDVPMKQETVEVPPISEEQLALEKELRREKSELMKKIRNANDTILKLEESNQRHYERGARSIEMVEVIRRELQWSNGRLREQLESYNKGFADRLLNLIIE